MSRAESITPVNEEVAEEVPQDFDEIDKLAELAIGASDIKKYVFPHKTSPHPAVCIVRKLTYHSYSIVLLLPKNERCRVLHGLLCPHEDEEGSM